MRADGNAKKLEGFIERKESAGSLSEILLVDKATDIRRVVEIWLARRASIKLTVVMSVRGAKKLLQTKTFDLVIAAEELPDGTGDEIFDHLRLNQNAKTKFILFAWDFCRIGLDKREQMFGNIEKYNFAELFELIRKTGILSTEQLPYDRNF